MKTNNHFLVIVLLICFAARIQGQKCADPTNLTATNITETSATLNWTGVAAHLSFAVDVMHAAQTANFKWNTSTTSTSVDVQGLEPGSTYRFKVQASCEKGKGNSAWVEFTTAGEKTSGPGSGDKGNDSPGPCAKATNLAVREVTDSTVILTWKKDSTHLTYRLDVKSKEHTPHYNKTYDLQDTFKLIEGLAAGGNYHFRVMAECAKNSAGSSAWIDFSTTGNDRSTQSCPKPKNLSILSVTDSTALLSWILQDSVKNFFLEIRNSTATPAYYKGIQLTDTFYLATKLVANGKYRFRVKATCKDGATSGSSDWAPFTTASSSGDDSESTTDDDQAVTKETEPTESTSGRTKEKFLTVNLFPNPVDQNLNVDIPEDQQTGTTEIQISDFSGRVVITKTISGQKVNRVQIPVEELENGYYQLTMRKGSVLSKQKFFIHHQ